MTSIKKHAFVFIAGFLFVVVGLRVSAAEPTGDSLADDKAEFSTTKQKAMALAQSGQFDSAVKLVEDFLKDNPNSYYGHLWLGNSYVGDKKVEKGLELLNRAAKLEPKFFAAYLEIGNSYDKSNEKANENYLKALELAKADDNVFGEIVSTYSLGNLYRRRDKLDESLKWLQDCLAAAPTELVDGKPLPEDLGLDDEDTVLIKSVYELCVANTAGIYLTKNDLVNATKLVTSFIKAYPDNQPAQQLLAKIKAGAPK
jgi:tetratricopeptide (TPR) repeat protein